MMGNGMPPQNMMMNNSMQRPQSGNQFQQIHARIVSFFVGRTNAKCTC